MALDDEKELNWGPDAQSCIPEVLNALRTDPGKLLPALAVPIHHADDYPEKSVAAIRQCISGYPDLP